MRPRHAAVTVHTYAKANQSLKKGDKRLQLNIVAYWKMRNCKYLGTG